MKYLSVIAMLILTGCAHKPPDMSVSLYHLFQEFGEAVRLDVDSAKETYATQELADFHDGGATAPEPLRVSILGSLPTKIVQEEHHFEAKYGNQGCLTFNGLDEDQEPKTLSIYYVWQDGRWLMNKLYMAVHETKEGYYMRPYCPEFQ